MNVARIDIFIQNFNQKFQMVMLKVQDERPLAQNFIFSSITLAKRNEWTIAPNYHLPFMAQAQIEK